MPVIKYPVLYYEASAELCVGMLVGSTIELTDQHIKGVKLKISDYLQKQYKKFEYTPYYELTQVQLSGIKVAIRPVIRNDTGIFPLKEDIEVPVTLVHGLEDSGTYVCFLPLQGIHFNYYETEQLKPLAKYFATYYFSSLSPEQLYRMMMMPAPQLEYVSLKVSRKPKWSKELRAPDHRFLLQLAEQYPAPKSLSKRQKSTPDIAWELDDKVQEVEDKIVMMQANLLVVGNQGVGKSAVMKSAIRKIVSQAGGMDASYTFWRLKPQRIVASARYLGEWQQICEQLIFQLQGVRGILWVEDIIRLLELGGTGTEDSIAAYMVAFLQQQKLQIIGEVTPGELESLRRYLPAFVSCFQVVKIEEMQEEKVFKVIDQFARYVQQVFKLSVTKEANALAYRLLKRYYPYESFPGKAIVFLGKCISEVRSKEESTIDAQVVLNQFIRETGFPEMLIRDDMELDEAELSDYFDKRIIGQPMANEMMKSLVRIFKAGINNPDKPITTAIFSGPTGVGKTEAAKALAGYFFGAGQSNSPLIRMDMSEIQSPEQINKFIGYGRNPGQLIQLIREKPFSVLLLDEVEKAHPAIFDALMTVFDEGFLTDAYGRTTNFRNTIIIMTSNLGASNKPSLGFNQGEAPHQSYQSAIKDFFRPEFLNRIDNVLIFQSLTEAAIRIIARKELEQINEREGAKIRNLHLKFSDNLLDYIVNKGFDERYGARPLQRAIEVFVINPFAYWMLENPGVKDVVLLLDYKGSLLIQIQKSKSNYI